MLAATPPYDGMEHILSQLTPKLRLAAEYYLRNGSWPKITDTENGGAALSSARSAVGRPDRKYHCYTSILSQIAPDWSCTMKRPATEYPLCLQQSVDYYISNGHWPSSRVPEGRGIGCARFGDYSGYHEKLDLLDPNWRRPLRACADCGAEFAPNHSQQRFCGGSCKEAASGRRRIAYRARRRELARLPNAREVNRRSQRKRRSTPKGLIESRMRGRFRAALVGRASKTREVRCKDWSASWSDILGCSWEELAQHLVAQLPWGEGPDRLHKYHIDHIQPLWGADMTDIRQVKRLWHWSNLRPLCVSENAQKSRKPPTPEERRYIRISKSVGPFSGKRQVARARRQAGMAPPARA